MENGMQTKTFPILNFFFVIHLGAIQLFLRVILTFVLFLLLIYFAWESFL